MLECKNCAVIYRSRQQWYGNKTPEEMGAVVTEIQHVWPGVNSYMSSWRHQSYDSFCLGTYSECFNRKCRSARFGRRCVGSESYWPGHVTNDECPFRLGTRQTCPILLGSKLPTQSKRCILGNFSPRLHFSTQEMPQLRQEVHHRAKQASLP